MRLIVCIKIVVKVIEDDVCIKIVVKVIEDDKGLY